jgi:hypothetical protein
MRKRFSNWLRWKLIPWMDRYDDICWSDLVCWAAFPEGHEFSKIWRMRGTAGQCRRMGQPYNYCGKCDVTGYGGMLFIPR